MSYHTSPAHKRQPTIAVVLGSGGVKAFSALALFEFLDEAGIAADWLIGCSGGAVMAALRATGHSTQQMQEMVSEFLDQNVFSRRDYRTLLSLVGGPAARFDLSRGLLKPDGMRARLRKVWGETRLEDLHPRTLLQVTDFHTAQGQALEQGLVADAVYASCALYPALPPICIDGRWYVDGGFTAPCPILEAVKRQADIILALTVETRFSREPENFMQTLNYGQIHCANHLIRNQMTTAINLHHYEIVQINVRFDRNIEFWNFAEIPFVFATGRQAVAAKKEAILSAIANFPAYWQRAAAG
ncbi:MAG TPA: patatin-like phospholipase family protein [Blastocatellia bacterium]|nr:patatin-like phospholipase family protein [Blastocatellia bacterium]